MIETKKFASSEGCVWKNVFDFGDAITEAVLYRYEDFYKRTVLCVSVQSGCPVGCNFCGTGKKFIRNLTTFVIVYQVKHILKDMNIEDVDSKGERFQIMFMSMGEPMLNVENVLNAISELHELYPNAELLVSTVAPKVGAFNKFILASALNSKIGLQFSVHEAFDEKRNELIPYKNKHSLREMRNLGIDWNRATKRPVYITYCISETNHSKAELERLKDLFPTNVFNITFSVICSPDENMKEAGYREFDVINAVQQEFLEEGYNVRIFNPAGQDDIGGGCRGRREI